MPWRAGYGALAMAPKETHGANALWVSFGEARIIGKRKNR